MNILAIIFLVCSIIALFWKKREKIYRKGLAFIGFIIIGIGLIVYYMVADDVGVWTTDVDNLCFGASGWLNGFAGIFAIITCGLI